MALQSSISTIVRPQKGPSHFSWKHRRSSLHKDSVSMARSFSTMGWGMNCTGAASSTSLTKSHPGKLEVGISGIMTRLYWAYYELGIIGVYDGYTSVDPNHLLACDTSKWSKCCGINAGTSYLYVLYKCRPWSEPRSRLVTCPNSSNLQVRSTFWLFHKFGVQ